jgi:predicted phosphodiesterase
MRLLAISDIHNNVSCVRKLREQETNRYQAVVVAGDIGRQRAAEVLRILKSFACPVVFVNGNWDGGGDAAPVRGRWLKPAHLRVVRVGELSFFGYSYAPAEVSTSETRRRSKYTAECRAALREQLKRRRLNLRESVLVTHDRAAHLGATFPGLLMHLYGHVHTFDRFERNGTTYVNVSALDRPRAVQSAHQGAIRYVNAGNYAVITIRGRQVHSVECRLLRRDYAGWRVLPRGVALSFPPDELFVG